MGNNITPVLKRECINPEQGLCTGVGFVSQNNDVNLTTPKLDLSGDFTIEWYGEATGSNVNSSFLGTPKWTGENVFNLYAYCSSSGKENGVAYFLFNNNTKESISAQKYYSIGTKFHVIVTRNNLKATAYINGVKAGEVTQSDYLSLINQFRFANNCFTGHVRFFNYGMGIDEVKKLYNGGRSDKYVLDNKLNNIDIATQSGCIAEYLPQSITPTIWYDTSGQGNDATANGEVELIFEKPYQEVLSVSSAPTVTPDFVGQLAIKRDAEIYEAKDTTSASDWVKIGG